MSYEEGYVDKYPEIQKTNKWICHDENSCILFVTISTIHSLYKHILQSYKNYLKLHLVYISVHSNYLVSKTYNSITQLSPFSGHTCQEFVIVYCVHDILHCTHNYAGRNHSKFLLSIM